MKAMTTQQALKLLHGVCSAYKGNFQEHMLLQEALRTIEGKPSTLVPVPNKVSRKKTRKKKK